MNIALKKKKTLKETTDKKINNHMKNIIKTYLDLGLLDGYVDKNGKTILTKEAFDEWD